MRPALFPPPKPDNPKLSDTYAAPRWRAYRGDIIRWTRHTTRGRADCDECAALQHETRGTYWPRRQVRAHRVVNADRANVLRLCGAHASAWKERDEADQRGTP